MSTHKFYQLPIIGMTNISFPLKCSILATLNGRYYHPTEYMPSLIYAPTLSLYPHANMHGYYRDLMYTMPHQLTLWGQYVR